MKSYAQYFIKEANKLKTFDAWLQALVFQEEDSEGIKICRRGLIHEAGMEKDRKKSKDLWIVAYCSQSYASELFDICKDKLLEIEMSELDPIDPPKHDLDQIYLEIKPVPKPRMTQKDRWACRPCVVRYFEFKNKIRASGMTLPDAGGIVTFHVEMPKSWSKKKKSEFVGKPHKNRPDVDNYLKALLDACFDEDSCIYDIRVKKFWSVDPGILIETPK